MVIGANVVTYKELVSAMAKCHKTIEVIRGVPTGTPGPARGLGSLAGHQAASAALMSAVRAGSRRSLSRHRLRFGPMLPTGMPGLALISV